MLIVTGYVYLEPADVDEFVTGIEALGRITRARDGCLSYAAALEDRLAGRMLVVERWKDQGALTAHLRAIETAVFVESWQGKMTGDILKFDASNERALMDE